MKKMAKVGIKLADGKFYPILDEHSFAAKKLELTTVRDGQTSAQIDFFRSDESADEAQYIGTLVVDGLTQRYAGETSIDLRVRTAEDGRILAEVEETDGAGGPQKLEIDLNALNADELDRDDARLDNGGDSSVEMAKKVNPVVPVVIAAVIFLLAALVFLFVFLSQGFPRPTNVYVEPQSREEAAVSPPVSSDAAKLTERPPDSAPEAAGPPADNARESLPPETNVSDTSRKALRTETGR
jgi:hypothetical protein